ncbi:NAD-dependent epimerase/dehydratase family protein [Streptomyces tubercidicus]|uniref:NAD-dependent epimerase n=1 Tax=Streptomyces tubercidicus TaxID=47759 RepID=A0A640UXM5_9ACTN|nr:NAD(P)-dependent oxidoreductase [Streptomyces tubercidicus]WAU13620.1 NAD(P)-dependent oxidoreductase [Streptomyces tubercidicus]GFE39245.1 NAD-dependent epimerase [Streptomyces tubercidicus]
MILVTGGLGFIGSHTVRALLDLGEDCVVVQRRASELPAVLDGARVAVERADITDRDALLAIGRRHRITGIVHLAGSFPWPPVPEEPVEATRQALGGLLNVVEAAQEWGVRRLGVASTIGVYFGAGGDGPLREDAPLAMSAAVSIPTFKKVGELLGGFLADATGVDIVNYRISGTWGPLGHPDPFFAAPALIHAAARGTVPDLSHLMGPAFAEDGLDLSYVKDTGRAIALLQLAGRLNHRTYNVGSGRATTNAQIVEAIRGVVPGARVGLPAGGGGPHMVLDIGRLQEDTGYRAEYDTERAVSDYIGWLRAGNER